MLILSHAVTVLMETVIFPMQQLVMQETNVGILEGMTKHFGVTQQITTPDGTFVMFPCVREVKYGVLLFFVLFPGLHK